MGWAPMDILDIMYHIWKCYVDCSLLGILKVQPFNGPEYEWSLQVVVKASESFAAVSRGAAGVQSRQQPQVGCKGGVVVLSQTDAPAGSVASLVFDTLQALSSRISSVM